MTLEEIVNGLKSAGQDYSQLFNNNPKYTAVASNVTKGLENLVPPQFANTQDAKSQEYSKKLAEWALGNGAGMSGMALSTKIPNPIKDNLNAKLVQKYLSTGKLSPKEMIQYEANGLAMETPQLQRYNVANAMVNPERQAYKETFNTPVFHGTNDVITAPDYAFSGKGADQLGSAALYTSEQPSLASGFAKSNISGGNVLPLALRNTSKYMSDELEKKLTPAQIREFVTKSPNEYALSDFGDVGYEGKNKVINSVVQGYHQYGDEKLLDTLNSLNNDFYRNHPEAFNKLAEKLTKKSGVVMDTGENKIYATWNPKDIRSRFAAFDPLRKNSSSLLASGLLGALLFNNENKNLENK